MEPPPTASRPPGRRLAWRGFALLGVGIAVSLGTMGLARYPGVVERVYGAEVGPRVARALSILTGWAPFSVAVVLVVGLASLFAVRWCLVAARLRKDAKADRVATVVREANRFAGVVGILLLLFYPLWGFHYARAPLDERLGLQSDSVVETEALVDLLRLAVTRTNQAYLAVHGGIEDAGAPTRGRVDPVEISRALEVGWARVAPALGMSRVAARSYGPVKTRGVTWMVDFLDIAGIYVPFTGEAHASGSQPDLSFPAVAAHEQAHQRGIAWENEATFAGALAAIHADDALARYSGWARVLRALQADIVRVDREAWRTARGDLLPGVLRDWQGYIDYLLDSRSVAAPIVEATNDAYLRAHGVPGGIQSYDRVTTLLLAWARRHGGDLVIDDSVTESGTAGARSGSE